MARPEMTIAEILSALEATPAELARVLASHSDRALREAPGAGEWSALENLAHLRACADVRGAAAGRILAEDHPRFRDVSPRVHQRTTDYVDVPFAASLAAFRDQRADLLRTLRAIPAEGWERTATVIRNGRPVEWTVRWYGDWLASHEQAHLRQIGAALAEPRKGD